MGNAAAPAFFILCSQKVLVALAVDSYGIHNLSGSLSFTEVIVGIS